MKKYLMTGIAALALCAGFTSCSHDLDVPSPEKMKEMEAQKIVEKYNKAFEATFGKPKANHNWGFGPTAAARTRTADPTANIWAASDGDKWIVPPELTATQKDIVRQYFQQNPDPDYDDPEWTNYFVQQVYKGGTNTEGSLSQEKYESANSVDWNKQYVVGSDHMDHLCAVYDDETKPKEHINNFNFGDYPNPYPNVLDYSKEVQYKKNDNENHHHADQIMLMVNSTTENFGYFNSDGSLGHIDYTGLVDWKTIYDWAKGKGITGYEELNDGWNRSYMGFDFEQVVGYDIYVHTDVDVLDEEGKVIKVVNKKGETVNQKEVRYAKISDMSPAKSYAWDGKNVIELTDEIKNSYLTYKDDDGVEHLIPLLVEQTNEYCGDNHDIDGNSIYIKKQYPNSTQVDDVIDLTVFTEKAKAGQLPVINSTLLKWVEVKGGADHYYSDWIVTLTEANHYGEIPTPETLSIRVMAEDLSVTDPQHDFDFNDVVFDVIRVDDDNAKIILQAAGGTLPLRVNSTDGVGGFEVHAKFGVETNVMVNTRWKGAQRVSPVDCGTITITGGFSKDNFYETVRNIRVEVEKTGSDGNKVWVELSAPKDNTAPSKFGCPIDTDWVDERVFIDDIYTFSEWVTGANYTLEAREIEE